MEALKNLIKAMDFHPRKIHTCLQKSADNFKSFTDTLELIHNPWWNTLSPPYFPEKTENSQGN